MAETTDYIFLTESNHKSIARGQRYRTTKAVR